MIEANKFKLGMFVISAFALFLAAIFVFGLADIFKRNVKVFSVFQDSVQGLSVGSQVKFKGVPIGKVKKIQICGGDELIVVVMELDLSAYTMRGNKKGFSSEEFEKLYHEQIKRGITCGLELAGITGMKYVEFDYIKNKKDLKLPPRPKGIQGYYIPSRPSVIQNIIKMINKSLSNIASVNIKGIADEANGVLKGANSILNDPKLKETITKFEKIADNLDKGIKNILNNPKLKKAVERLDDITANLNKGLKTFNGSISKEKIDRLFKSLEADMDNFNKLVNQVRKELRSAKLSKTAAAFRKSADTIVESKLAVMVTLQRLSQTLESITELINYIDDDPSSLIKGKHKKPITGKDGKILSKYLDNKKQD